LVPSLKWAYLRFFPSASKWLGYGRVDDKLPANVTKASVEVTYYSLLGCPFCPIVEQRLKTLQAEMDFTLTTIDLTFKPQLSASKGIRSVPVVRNWQPSSDRECHDGAIGPFDRLRASIRAVSRS
jgi:hypothetical protein